MTDNPFSNNPFFKQSCEICEAYTGTDHFYGDCTKCPVFKMAVKLEAVEKERNELRAWKSWTEYPERMGR